MPDNTYQPASPQVTQDLQKFIKSWEGFSNIVYLDTAGYLTIGYGHKLTGEELDDLKQNSGMKIEEIKAFLIEEKKNAANLKKYHSNPAGLPGFKEKADKLIESHGKVANAMRWSEEEAQKALDEHLATTVKKVREFTKDMPLTENQIAALGSLAYNVGADEVFLITQRDAHGKKLPYDPNQKSAMYQALKDGDFETAAKLFLVFNHAGGKVDPNMDDRRNAEMNLFLKKPDKSPAQQPPNQAAGPNRQPAPLSAIELYAREMAAARANIVQAQSSYEVAGDIASAGAAVDHPQFTTESQWIDYIIGMLVDMLSKPRVFYYHITIETELAVLSRFSVALTLDWSGNLLSCQRLDNGDSYCGIIGPPEKIVASQGARTFIC